MNADDEERITFRLRQTHTKQLGVVLAASVALAAVACVSGSIPPRPKDAEEKRSGADVAPDSSVMSPMPDSSMMTSNPVGGMMSPSPDSEMTSPIAGRRMLSPSSDGGAMSPGSAGAMATNTCTPSTKTDACSKCTDENCCAEYTRCHDDLRCTMYYTTCIPQCLAGGKDYSSCEIDCSSNGAGHAEFVPYQACMQLHCLGPCAGRQLEKPCVQCAYAACRDQAYACDSDSACDLLQACRTLCLDRPDIDACVAACNRAVDDGVKTKYDALTNCRTKYCPDACGDESDSGTPDPTMSMMSTCTIAAKTLQTCCNLTAGPCDTQANFVSCCLGTTCPSFVAQQYACMAGQNAFDTNSCLAALDTCGVGTIN